MNLLMVAWVRSNARRRVIFAVFLLLIGGSVGVRPLSAVEPAPAPPFLPFAPDAVTAPDVSGPTYTAPSCWLSVSVTSAMWLRFIESPTGGPYSDPAEDPCSLSATEPSSVPHLAPGATVSFPAGSISLAGPLVISRAADLTVDGSDTSFTQTSCTAGFVVEGSARVVLDHLAIVGTYPSCPNGHAIQIFGAVDDGVVVHFNEDILVKDCTVDMAAQDAVYIGESRRVAVTGCSLTNAGRQGISVIGFTSDVTLQENIITDVGYLGIDVEPNHAPADISMGDPGAVRVAILDNQIDDAPEGLINASANESDVGPSITIQDLTVTGNSTSSKLKITAQGKPWQLANWPTAMDPDRLAKIAEHLNNSGQVRRVFVADNVSSSADPDDGAEIHFNNSVYVTVAGNVGPTSSEVSFAHWSEPYTACFMSEYNNSGFTLKNNSTPLPDQQLPPAELSVAQFVNQIVEFQSGDPLPLGLVRIVEWEMCHGLDAEGVVDLFADSGDAAYSDTSYAERLRLVDGIWYAASGALPGTAIAQTWTRIDPGSVDLATSSLAKNIGLAALDEYPSLVSLSVDDFIDLVMSRTRGRLPTSSERGDWQAMLHYGNNDQEQLRAELLGAVTYGDGEDDDHLKAEFLISAAALLTIGEQAPGTWVTIAKAIVTSSTVRGDLTSICFGTAEYLALSPVDPTID